MRSWIESLRPDICALAAFLAVVSFRVAGVDPQALPVVAIFIIASTTMVQNDWRDRFQDVQKGKSFALEHESSFFRWLVTLWGLSGLLIAGVWYENNGLGSFLLVIALAGLLYSETRKIAYAPVVIVAVVSASPALFPYFMGSSTVWSFVLFVSAGFTIFAREIMKDLLDKNSDLGYKWTIPVAFGEESARNLVAIAGSIAFATLTLLSFVSIFGSAFALLGVILCARGVKITLCITLVDIGILLAFAFIMLYG